MGKIRETCRSSVADVLARVQDDDKLATALKQVDVNGSNTFSLQALFDQSGDILNIRLVREICG
jgi:hypothetical protein